MLIQVKAIVIHVKVVKCVMMTEIYTIDVGQKKKLSLGGPNKKNIVVASFRHLVNLVPNPLVALSLYNQL